MANLYQPGDSLLFYEVRVCFQIKGKQFSGGFANCACGQNTQLWRGEILLKFYYDQFTGNFFNGVVDAINVNCTS